MSSKDTAVPDGGGVNSVEVAGFALVAAAVAAVALVALPALAVAGAAQWVAWKRGWEPHQMRWYVIWAWVSLPLFGALVMWDVLGPARLVWDAAQALAAEGGVSDWRVWARIPVVGLVWSIPLGWTLGWIGWARYRSLMERGRAKDAEKAERHRNNMQKHKWQNVKQQARYYDWPLIQEGKKGVEIVLGPCLERTERVPRHPVWTLTARHLGALTIPYSALRKHLVFMAAPGNGKTVALLRLSLGSTVAAWKEHAAGRGGRPLNVRMSCKGGPETREDGFAYEKAMANLGIQPERVGFFPVMTRLNMWELPADDLEAALHDLIRTDNEYYQQVNEAALHLVVSGPRSGTPSSSPEFLRRINREWLENEWQGHPIELEAVAALYEGQGSQGRTILLQYYNLFRKLGNDFDAGFSLDDFDAIFVEAEGGKNRRLAAAQVSTILKLITSRLTDTTKPRREVIIEIDEWSAVSDEINDSIESVVEQFRSLGGSVTLVAQTEQSFGPDEWSVRRLLGSCAGGRVLLQTDHADIITGMGGTIRRADVSNVVADGMTTGAASSRVQDKMRIDPERVRNFEIGEVVYAGRGAAEWGRVVPVGDLAEVQLWEAAEMRELTAKHRQAIGGVSKQRKVLEAERLAAIGQAPVAAEGTDDDGLLGFGSEVV